MMCSLHLSVFLFINIIMFIISTNQEYMISVSRFDYDLMIYLYSQLLVFTFIINYLCVQIIIL